VSTGHAPDWTVEEFDTLLDGHQLADDVLTARLPGRALGAVQTVRRFVCAYHKGQNTSGLSRMMKSRLATRTGTLTCRVCGARF
jgi:hypothetical protein